MTKTKTNTHTYIVENLLEEISESMNRPTTFCDVLEKMKPNPEGVLDPVAIPLYTMLWEDRMVLGSMIDNARETLQTHRRRLVWAMSKPSFAPTGTYRKTSVSEVTEAASRMALVEAELSALESALERSLGEADLKRFIEIYNSK